MLREMQARQLGPSALLLNFANPILAQGAAFAGLPLIDRFEADITSVLKSGDRVRVSPRTGEVLVLERDAAQP
jgi:predicted aconitase with swiveling domain